MAAQKIFRDKGDSFGSKKQLVNSLVDVTERMTSKTQLPTCHNIKNKLLKHYFTLRMHIYARKHEAVIRSQVKQTKGRSDLGSKSMTMRAAVNKYG